MARSFMKLIILTIIYDLCHGRFVIKLVFWYRNIKTIIMTINIQFVNLDYSDSLAEFTTKKLNKLVEKYDWLISADVFFKEEGTNPDKGKICNIKLGVPGPDVFATSDEKNFEMAVKESISDLQIQLKKKKQAFKAY